MSLPRSAGAQPYSYLHPALGEGRRGDATCRPHPRPPFGHGLSYTTFDHTDLTVPADVPTDGALTVTVRVTNTGAVAGDDVVQLYGRDLVGLGDAAGRRSCSATAGSTSRPGESVTVEFTVPTTRLAFSDRTLTRVVEPGDVELWVGTSARRDTQALTTLVGDVVVVTDSSARWTTSTDVR